MIVSGHQHLNVSSIDEHKRFFIDTLGGRSITAGTSSIAGVRFPNVLILLREQRPAGGTKGTTVNHVAFGVPDIRSIVATVKAAGYSMVTRAEVPPSLDVHDDLCYMADQQTHVAFTMAPDATKVEFIEVVAQSVPIAFHHIHFAAPNVADMKAWYVGELGAKPGKRGNFEAADLSGINLTYSAAATPVVGTRGRAIDHIGFEVNNLEGLCAKLEKRGIKLDRPFTRIASINASTAFITDPWGTHIELTEGLTGS